MKNAELCTIFLHISITYGIIYARSLIRQRRRKKRNRRKEVKSMTEAAAQARKEYWKAWRKANADKVRQYNKTYWERKAAKAAEGAKNENKDCVYSG